MKLYLESKDHSVSGEEFQLFQRTDLDMLVTQPKPENLEPYYQSDSYISHTDSHTTVIDKIYQTVKKYNLRKKIGLANRYVNTEKTLLDVGAGTGEFVLVAKQNGWSAKGIEPNKIAQKRAFEKGEKLYKDFESLKDSKFQIITLWHVLEHLPNLEEHINKLKNLLADNGTLIVAVPNFKSFDAQYYGNFWAGYDVPRHLWHFSRGAMKTLFSKQGMKVVDIKPMLFDAFYVSLLSEKYKTGRQQFFRAFFIGLKSNLSAWKNKEYSSLIYIIKKA